MTTSDFFQPGGGGHGPEAEAAERREAEAARWLLQHRGGLDAAGRAAFQAWLAADPRHGEEYAELERVWSRLDRIPRAAIDRLGPVAAVPAPVAAKRFWPRWLPAGGAALAALVLAAGWAWTQWRPEAEFSAEYATGRGQQDRVALPDGSRLDLDADTRVRVSFYRGRRQAVLERGRSMFEVSRNPERPFEVLAADVRVHVLGTRFSVGRSRSPFAGEERVVVAVEEGHVQVQSASSRSLVDLLPGRGGRPVADLTGGQGIDADAGKGLGEVERITPGAVAPWRGGRTLFDDVPLAEALAEFERYGDTGLVIRDPRVAALRVSGNFDLRPAAGFAKALPVSLPVKLVPHGDGKLEIVLE